MPNTKQPEQNKKHTPANCPMRGKDNGTFGCTDCMPEQNKTISEGEKKIIYYQLESDVMTFVGTRENIIDHLKEYYFNMKEDWFDNKEVVKIKAIKMTANKFNDLGEWEP